jgi:uncharacterized membrane protein YhhN
MSVIKIDERRVKPVVFAVTGLFLCLSVLFFTPVPIPHKLCLPMGVLVASSLWLTPWEIFMALFFSILGDWFGSCGSFLPQMGSFAVGHMFYILFFIRRFLRKVERDRKLTAKAKGYFMMLAICVLTLMTMVFVRVVPSVPSGVLRVGVSIYAVLICTMLFSALLQRSLFYAIGALLFVISDFILAWNKFVEPVPYRDALVLGTYLSAQWFLFVRSTPYRVKHPVHLLRF